MLQRRGGRHAPLAVLLGVGEVEQLQEARRLLAADGPVEGAASEGGFVELAGGAELAAVELLGECEDGIAPGFGIEPPTAHSRKPAIVWILRPGDRRLTPSVRREDFPMEPLERPAVVDKTGSQIFQQVGVRRTLAQLAEVAGRAYEPLAEMPGPNAIHDHARSQRSRLCHDRFR